MSKRNRNARASERAAARKVAPDLHQKASGIAALANALGLSMSGDGYSNAAAFLGHDSPLISSGTFIRSNLTRNTELLTTMYRENWLAMRIIDMPSEDMTRAWYKPATSLDADDLDALRKLEAKHSVKQEIANAIRWARLYGGAIAVIAIRGQENMMELPLNLQDIAPGDFQGLLVLDRTQAVEPSLEIVSDLDDPDYGLPEFYRVNIDVNHNVSYMIHHSRVLRFIGRELPRLETVSENYWGASEMEHIWDELQKRNATSANIAQLVFQANITTLKMGDFGEAMALGTDEQRRNVAEAMAWENRFRTSYGLQLLSAADTMENHQYTFAGLSDVYEEFMLDISGAAEIPATKLFGRTPAGLNSTGESDLRNYYETIASMQERILRPALEKLVPVEAMSCWGFVPDDLEIVFEPIAAITPSERAALVSQISDPIIKAFQAGLISREDAVAELKSTGEEFGFWSKLADPFSSLAGSPSAAPAESADPPEDPADDPDGPPGEVIASADDFPGNIRGR